MQIPKSRDDQIALRDKLNALINHPGADPTPIPGHAAVSREPRNSRVSPSLHFPNQVYLGIGTGMGAHLTRDNARLLAARLVFVADNIDII